MARLERERQSHDDDRNPRGGALDLVNVEGLEIGRGVNLGHRKGED